MEQLIDYVIQHTARGECQCGKCCDKGQDREAPQHSADVVFFWVSAANDPTAAELRRLLVAEYPDMERWRGGPSYIEIGGALGSQEIALRLIGLGKILNLWDIATPKDFGLQGEELMRMAGNGFLMPTGLREA